MSIGNCLDYVQEWVDAHNPKKKKQDIVAKDLEVLDFEVFYNLAWIMAKTADSSIPEPILWLEQFDEFPMAEIIPELQDMLLASIQTTKKK